MAALFIKPMARQQTCKQCHSERDRMLCGNLRVVAREGRATHTSLSTDIYTDLRDLNCKTRCYKECSRSHEQDPTQKHELAACRSHQLR